MKNITMAIATLLLACGTSFACKCADPGTVQEAFEKTSLIVHGKIVASELVSFEQTFSAKKARAIKNNLKSDSSMLQLFESRLITKVEVEIIKKYKDSYRKSTISIYTSESSASCGYSFEEGKEYVIYLSPPANSFSSYLTDRTQKRGRQNKYWTNLCTRTTDDVRNETEELNLIKKS